MISAVRQVRITLLRRRDTAARRVYGRRLHTIGAQQRHLFTFYSGFRPFVGSGLDVRTWSFAQRLVHAKHPGSETDQEYDELPFTAKELIQHLKKMIEGLKDDYNDETRLPGLT